MSERFNGNVPYTRRTHGSSRRGVFAVPSHNYLAQLQQSQSDKERLLSAIKEKATHEEAEDLINVGLGNKELPIYRFKKELVDTIEANKAVILMGATGSGKSTQVPQYLFEAGYDHVYIIEGRRIMADGLGERIQSELNEQLGEEAAENLVGIIHGGRNQLHKDNKITAMTSNTFIRMASQIQEKHKGMKVAVIPDEIHEDDPYTEIAVGVAGLMVRDEEDFRLIGASATINPDVIKKPLGRITNPTDPSSIEVPVFKVEGRPYNVEIKHVPGMNPAEAYLAFGRDHRIAILSTKGKKEIDAITGAVKKGLTGRSLANTEFRELSGATSPYQRSAIERLAQNLPEDKHLVVVASPAARSGITITGATFAATDGMINREIRDDDGYWGLVTDRASQAELIQICGRVGRDAPGAVAYICDPMPSETRNPKRIEEFKALYPFMAMNERPEYPTPAIFNTNISGMMLEVAAINKEYSEVNQYTLNELDEPAIHNVRTRLISTFGAFDNDGKITDIGKLMDKFPVVAELSRGLAEATLNGRSRQHMARAALLAAAVDVGGVQQFNGKEQPWKQLLKSGSDDDFIAQLDIMIALRSAGKDHKTIQDRYQYLWEYDLSYKRADDAQKMAQKILARLGIDNRSFEIESPSYTDIADLREDFTAGMFDLVYRDAGMLGKERMYTHVRDREKAQFRTISKRSVTEPASGQIIAGIPQYYQETIKGKIEIKDVLTMTLKVDPRVVGHFALQNHLVEFQTIKGSAMVNGGMVLEKESILFGSLRVGSREVVKSRERIPVESQRKLVQYVLANPGTAQLFLRDTAEELSEYRRILPTEELKKYRRSKAPADLTKGEVERLLKYYAERTRNAQELDFLLSEHASQKNISIDQYYDARARAEILERSPNSIEIGGVITDILYDNGMPYVTRISKEQESAITGPIFLEDGRQVLRQVRKEGGRGTRRVPFGSN